MRIRVERLKPNVYRCNGHNFLPGKTEEIADPLASILLKSRQFNSQIKSGGLRFEFIEKSKSVETQAPIETPSKPVEVITTAEKVISDHTLSWRTKVKLVKDCDDPDVLRQIKQETTGKAVLKAVEKRLEELAALSSEDDVTDAE